VEVLAGLTNFSTFAHDARGLSAMRVMAIGDSPDQMAGISIVASNRHVKWYTCRGRELFHKYERRARRSDRPKESAATNSTAKRGHRFHVSLLLSPSASERLPSGE
jgi:hypothetical protein